MAIEQVENNTGVIQGQMQLLASQTLSSIRDVRGGKRPQLLVQTRHRYVAGIRRLKELCHELSTCRAFKVDFGTHVSYLHTPCIQCKLWLMLQKSRRYFSETLYQCMMFQSSW